MCWWFFILYFPWGVEIVHILLRKMKDTECMIWFAKIQVRFATYLHTIAILSSREVHALSLLHFSREVHALSLLHAMIRQWQRGHMVMKTRHMDIKIFLCGIWNVPRGTRRPEGRSPSSRGTPGERRKGSPNPTHFNSTHAYTHNPSLVNQIISLQPWWSPSSNLCNSPSPITPWTLQILHLRLTAVDAVLRRFHRNHRNAQTIRFINQ